MNSEAQSVGIGVSADVEGSGDQIVWFAGGSCAGGGGICGGSGIGGSRGGDAGSGGGGGGGG